MKTSGAGRRLAWVVVFVGVFAASASFAEAQLLLRDDFIGTGNVNPTVWRLPFGSEGTFVGRTQFRGNPATDMPQEGIVEPLASDGKVAEIKLDTYSPIDPGNQFLGTDLLTKRNFARGGGLTFEARMRLKPTTVGGLVDGFFLFDVTRENPPGTLVRDEIDFELLSNQAVGAAANDPFTNYWNDEPFSDPGEGQFSDVAGVDLTQFQNYKVEWTPQHMKWYVNNQLIRTATTNVPDDPMKLHFNLWAPGSDFADAYNAALQPAATQGANQTYAVQVDHVEVNRINTTTSANLLSDPSFEVGTLVNLTPTNGGTRDQWLKFNNVFIEPDDIGGIDPSVPDMAPDGVFMAKMFGPFSGGPNASGLVQNVVATPGEQFEARAKALTAAGDSIAGKQNYNTVAISFLNASGNVIETAPFVPVNGKDFPLLDGRDPNMPQDLFVEGVVNAIAPAGTVSARISLFFLQLNNEGGASWFDDVSLMRLTPNVVTVPGDYNNNGIVDAADYSKWRDNLGAATEASINNNGDGGGVTASDYTYWKTRFGNTSGAGAGSVTAAVPEPASMLLVSVAILSSMFLYRPNRSVL